MVTYVSKQGSMATILLLVGETVLSMCRPSLHGAVIWLIPGDRNVMADQLLCQGQVRGT